MIYVTGDTHGDYADFVYRAEREGIASGDTLIICGDFGFVWDEDTAKIKQLSQMDFDIAFVDGNHENFDKLYSYPVADWNGGKVHKVSDNILHLMRGECFEIDGSTFFAFGGAYSVDKRYRRAGISWWQQELPTNDDYKNADKTLKSCGYKVDYVLSHTMPQSLIFKFGFYPDPHDAELTGYLQWLYEELDFKKWFAGHFHKNRELDNFRLLYNDVVKIGELEN